MCGAGPSLCQEQMGSHFLGSVLGEVYCVEGGPHGVRGLRPAEPLTPWVAWVCLPHFTPSFYGQGLRGPESRARPSPKLLPALAFPASSGSSLRGDFFIFQSAFQLPSREPRPSGSEPVMWTSWPGSREFAISWMGAQGQAWPLTREPCGHTWPGQAAGKPL